MLLDFLDDCSSIEELGSFFETEDLSILNDIGALDFTNNNESSDIDVESIISFHAEDLEESIIEDSNQSEKHASASDVKSYFSFDAEDLSEWIEEESHEKKISSSSLLLPTNQIQITNIENVDKINYANNLKTINHDKSIRANLVKSEINNNGAFGLFHRLNLSKLRTEISRQKVLQQKVTASNLSANENMQCRSFNMDSLKKRRFLFDLHESQKRLKSFSLQTSNDVQNTNFLGKRISLCEGTVDGRQNRLRQLRNETLIKNRVAVAA